MLRRTALAAGIGLLVTAPGRATGQSLPTANSLIGSRLDDRKLADCAAIKRLDEMLAAEGARSAAMPLPEIEAETRGIMNALQRRKQVADKAATALRSAQLNLALDAASGIVDLVVAACLVPPNELCIASAYGVKIVGGVAGTAVQLYQAQDASEQRVVAIAFAKSRTAMFRQLIGDLKPRPVNEAAIRAITRVAKVGFHLAKANAKVSDTKDDFDAAIAALEAMDKGYSDALASSANFRVYRQQHYTAQRWLLQVLIAGYPITCRTESAPLPMP